MTHTSPPHANVSDTPLDFEQFMQQLQALWLAQGEGLAQPEEPSRGMWSLTKLLGLAASVYALCGQLGELVVRVQHEVGEGDWMQVDELMRQGWEEVRESLSLLVDEHLDAVEWFEVLTHLDEQALMWLSDPIPMARLRRVLESVEGQADRLIAKGLDLMWAQSEATSPLTRVLEHREEIERWVGFVIERMGPRKSPHES